MAASLFSSTNWDSSSCGSVPMMRNRPCSNLRERVRAKSESKECEDMDDTAHIILVEATRRQIYPAAPPLRYCQFRNARLCRLPSLSRGVGYCRRAAIAVSVY